MCFSASASFGAGIVLSAIGVASIKKTSSPSQTFFAGIPLIFAVQQITEGFVWLSLSNPSCAFLNQPTTYLFLFFAQVVWPFWVPFAILKLEPKEKRRISSKILVGIGALVSLYLIYCLLAFPVESRVLEYHISYKQNYPGGISRYFGFLYLAATIAPPFFSRIQRVWMLGSIILASYVVTKIFFPDFIVSVWCFFASIISITVLIVLYGLSPKNNLTK